jgi:hypothetical protein
VKQGQTHLPSLFAAGMFCLGGFFLLGIALLMASTTAFSAARGEPLQAQQTIILVAYGFESILLFAAAFFTFQKTLQKPVADRSAFLPHSSRLIVIAVLAAAGAILLGSQISALEGVRWLILPFLTIPAIILPLGVLLALAARGLPLGTRWQTWSVLGLSMSLSPFLLLILEALVAIVLFVGVVGYIISQPELAHELQALSRQIMIVGPQSEAALDLLTPILTRPGVIATALLYIAILVPAIEEVLKPLGVWLLAGKLRSPAQGFTLGALSGAGYGMIETVGISAQAPGDWASLLFSRIGTGLLHITTSALVGAAIVMAWRERRFLRLLGAYLLAVLLHGLWNAFAMLFSFSELAELLEQTGWLQRIQPVLVSAMGLLAGALFVILILSNRRMRTTLPVAASETAAEADEA